MISTKTLFDRKCGTILCLKECLDIRKLKISRACMKQNTMTIANLKSNDKLIQIFEKLQIVQIE